MICPNCYSLHQLMRLSTLPWNNKSTAPVVIWEGWIFLLAEISRRIKWDTDPSLSIRSDETPTGEWGPVLKYKRLKAVVHTTLPLLYHHSITNSPHLFTTHLHPIETKASSPAHLFLPSGLRKSILANPVLYPHPQSQSLRPTFIWA